MSKTASINIRIEPKLKTEAEELYNGFGISLSDAINIFLKKSVSDGGLPFELKREKPKLDFSTLSFSDKQISSKEALYNITPITWEDDVLRGKRKVKF